MFFLMNQIKTSKTIFRNSVIISVGFFVFILIFNLLFLLMIKEQLTSVLDSKISHEMDHVKDSFKFSNDSLIIIRSSEFNEKDLVEIYDNSFFVQIISKDGRILLKSKNIYKFCNIPVEIGNFDKEDFFTNTKTSKELIRTGYKKIYNQNEMIAGYLQISARRIFLETSFNNIIFYNIIVSPFIFFIIILTSIIISKKINKPLKKIIDTSKKFSSNSLNIRIISDENENDEIKQLEKTLNDLFYRLEEQIKELSSFTYNVSHQLMNPLAIILSEIEYLIEKNSNDVNKKEIIQSLLLIKDKTIYIKKIVEALLILARSENNKNIKRVFSLNKLIEKNIKPLFNSGLLKVEIDSEVLLKGSEEYFSIVLQNLIDNAFKYSSTNSEVKLKVEKNEKSTYIYIIDYGIGISDQEKEKVFLRFYRSENPEKLKIKGLGLGLSLCSSIIKSMNGKITILDNQPNGSIFKIELPSINFN